MQHTAFGLFESGFSIKIVEAACADRGRDRHEKALALYGGYMYELVEVEGEAGGGGLTMSGERGVVEDRTPTVITADNYEKLAKEYLKKRKNSLL